MLRQKPEQGYTDGSLWKELYLWELRGAYIRKRPLNEVVEEVQEGSLHIWGDTASGQWTACWKFLSNLYKHPALTISLRPQLGFQRHGNNFQGPPSKTPANSNNPCKSQTSKAGMGTGNLYFMKWGNILGFPDVSFLGTTALNQSKNAL